MAWINWEESYSVGISEIDHQHKQLLGLINALHEYRERENQEFVHRVVATLVDYTKKHFFLEEKIMRNVNYPELDKHKQQHRSFIRKVEDFQRQLESDEVNLSDKILDYLGMWLSSHILIHDKAYQRYFKDHHIHS